MAEPTRENPLIKGVRRQMDGCSVFFYDTFVSLMVNGITGNYVEFGSWGANTLKLAYEELCNSGKPRHMWAFDSFEGLPPAADEHDNHPGWRPGSEQGQGGVDKFHEAAAALGVRTRRVHDGRGLLRGFAPDPRSDAPPTTSPSPTSTATCTRAP